METAFALRYCPIFFMMVALFLPGSKTSLFGPGGEAYAASITLAWDKSPDPNIAGYRVYARASGALYQYENPACQTEDTRCDVEIPTDSLPLYFVSRAISPHGIESADSNEVVYRPLNGPVDAIGFGETSVLPLPSGPSVYFYEPPLSPLIESIPELCEPLGITKPDATKLKLMVQLPPFEKAIDLYIAIYAPDVDPSVYLVDQALSLTPLQAGTPKFISNKLGDFLFQLFEDIPVPQLRPGTYHISIMVTPPNTPKDFYLWTTYFTVDSPT